jgi:hypothetical protein
MSRKKKRTAEKIPDRGKRRAIIATACLVVRGCAVHDMRRAVGRRRVTISTTREGEEGMIVRSCDRICNK